MKNKLPQPLQHNTKRPTSFLFLNLAAMFLKDDMDTIEVIWSPGDAS